MEISITDESHNQVTWEVKTPLVTLELGLLIGWLVLALIVVLIGSPARWIIVGGSGALLVGVGLFLAWRVPLSEQGLLERLPDGGCVQLTRRSLLRRNAEPWTSPYEALAGFRVETRHFEETGGRVYPLARLWLVLREGAPVRLTPWSAPQRVHDLGASLAKAGRLAFEADEPVDRS